MANCPLIPLSWPTTLEMYAMTIGRIFSEVHP